VNNVACVLTLASITILAGPVMCQKPAPAGPAGIGTAAKTPAAIDHTASI
jgi:hypothetical protein